MYGIVSGIEIFPALLLLQLFRIGCTISCALSQQALRSRVLFYVCTSGI
jgi:hypothetical protein